MRQSWVERVANNPNPHGAVPALHVRLTIPGQHAEMITLPEAERAERARQTPAAIPHYRIRYPGGDPVAATRHHFGGTVPLGRMIDEAVERERIGLHRARNRSGGHRAASLTLRSRASRRASAR